MHTRFALSALALALALPAQAATFSGAYFFGDSLSDSGTFGSKFTTNPAPVWSELVAQNYGQTATPNAVNPAGTNYAQGGAQVNTTPGFGSAPTTGASSVRQQVDAFLATNPNADSGALYGMWAGANDIFYQFQFAGTLSLAATAAAGGNFDAAEAYAGAAVQQATATSGPSQAAMTAVANAALAAAQADSAAGVASAASQGGGVAQTYVVQAATDMVGELARLKAAGARYIIVPNLPNIGDTPGGAQGADAQSQAQARATFNSLTGLYNTTLTRGLQAAGLEVISLNINGLLKEVMANPAPYGLTNTTGKACTTISSLICTPADLVAADAADTYLFADDVHPTAAVHAMIAQYTLAVIEAPTQMAQLPNVSLQNGRGVRGVLSNRLQLLRTSAAPGEVLKLYVDGGLANVDQDGFDGAPGTSGNNRQLTVGGDKGIGGDVHVGFAVSASSGSHDFDNDKGGFDLNEVAFSLYGGMKMDGFYSQTYAQLGAQEFANISRRVEIGMATIEETAHARGHRLGFGFDAGYDFSVGGLRTGPLVGLHYQRATVNSFHEDAADAVAMSYDKQNVKSLIARLGWSLHMEHQAGGARWLPFAQLAWENELNDDEREVRSGLTSSGTTFVMPVAASDGSYIDYRLGVGADFKTWQASLSYGGVSGRDQGSFGAVNLSVSSSF